MRGLREEPSGAPAPPPALASKVQARDGSDLWGIPPPPSPPLSLCSTADLSDRHPTGVSLSATAPAAAASLTLLDTSAEAADSWGTGFEDDFTLRHSQSLPTSPHSPAAASSAAGGLGDDTRSLPATPLARLTYDPTPPASPLRGAVSLGDVSLALGSTAGTPPPPRRGSGGGSPRRPRPDRRRSWRRPADSDSDSDSDSESGRDLEAGQTRDLEEAGDDTLGSLPTLSSLPRAKARRRSRTGTLSASSAVAAVTVISPRAGRIAVATSVLFAILFPLSFPSLRSAAYAAVAVFVVSTLSMFAYPVLVKLRFTKPLYYEDLELGSASVDARKRLKVTFLICMNLFSSMSITALAAYTVGRASEETEEGGGLSGSAFLEVLAMGGGLLSLLRELEQLGGRLLMWALLRYDSDAQRPVSAGETAAAYRRVLGGR